MNKNLQKEAIGFFAEENARLRLLLALPHIRGVSKIELFYKESDESLKKYPLLSKMCNESKLEKKQGE